MQLVIMWFYNFEIAHLAKCLQFGCTAFYCRDTKHFSYQRDTAVVPWHVYNTVLSSKPTSEAENPKLYELCHGFRHDMVFSMLIISLSGIIMHMLQFASVPKLTPSLT